MMLWSHVDCFSFGEFMYSRQEGNLKLPVYLKNTEHLLSRIRGCCRSLKVFTWHMTLTPILAALLVDKLGALKSLTVHVIEGPVLKPLLEHSGRTLKILELCFGYGGRMWYVDPVCPLALIVTFCVLTITFVVQPVRTQNVTLIANACPQLVSFSLRSHDFLEPSGFSTLFAACGKLEMFKLAISHLLARDYGRAALQTIFQHKVRLKTLNLAGGGFDELDAEWFRLQARDYQLLPIPTIVVRPPA